MGVRDTVVGAEVTATVSPNDRTTVVGAEVTAAVKNTLRDTVIGAEVTAAVKNTLRDTVVGIEYIARIAPTCTAEFIQNATTDDVETVSDAVAAIEEADVLLGHASAAFPNGRIPTDTATIEWDESVDNQVKASVVDGSIGATQLDETGVTPDTYGDSTHIPQITVDANGRVTDVTEVAASGGGSTALDDLTDVDAPTPSDGDVLTFNNGTGNWEAAAPSGGPGGSTPAWVNDAPDNPAGVGSEDPADDEFGSSDYPSESALDTGGTRFSGATGWSTYDNGATATITVGGGTLTIKAPAHSGDSFKVAYQAIPASGTFLFRVKAFASAQPANQSQVGIALVNASGGKVIVGTMIYNSNWLITALNYTLPGSWGGDLLTGTNYAGGQLGLWWFIEKTGSTAFKFLVSPTGLYRDAWVVTTINTASFLGTPDGIGVCANSNASVDVFGSFQHWRRLS